jgi:hypothetical protein
MLLLQLSELPADLIRAHHDHNSPRTGMETSIFITKPWLVSREELEAAAAVIVAIHL